MNRAEKCRTVAVLGLLPGIPLGIYAGVAFLYAPVGFRNGVVYGLATYIGSMLIIAGVYSLLRIAFGSRVGAFAPGLFAGLLSALALVLLPPLLIQLNTLGVWECRFISGLDCYGSSIGYSMLAIPVLPVFAYLCISTLRSK